MALLKKLKKLRRVKQDYFLVQHKFYSELSKRYPYIMNVDMADITNKLEDELTILLCSALKYKSIKIPLNAGPLDYQSQKTYVNVQRSEPGFYYAHSERGISDIHYMNLNQYIADNGDMRKISMKVTHDSNGRILPAKKEDNLLVALSELKSPENSGRVVPANLDAYFKHLKEVMAYRPKFLCYTQEGYKRKQGAGFVEGKLLFNLNARSMDVFLQEEFDKETRQYYGSTTPFRYNPSTDDIYRLLDYSGNYDTNFSKLVHNRLKIFIENYDVIKLRFEQEEAKKRRAYKTCQSFIKQIRTYTVPFKVLKEIQK